MSAWTLAALMIGLTIGGVVGFYVGVDAGLSVMAEAWLKRHPDEGDLTLRDHE